MIRIGHGFDVHRLGENRNFILGGIKIPHTLGLVGHSDADVLLHAITDALLGALALGDIGKHFPDSDKAYKDIDSSILLDKAYQLIRGKGFIINNIDTTVMLQRPKISGYINSIRQRISGILSIDIDVVSVKATTTEQLGFVGREEGVASTAVVTLIKEACK